MIENLEFKKQFFEQLDERQKRLFAALEAQALGRSGVRIISEALEIHPNTIRQGKKELANLKTTDWAKGRVRKPGGGRKKR
jgi:hypothetical protein